MQNEESNPTEPVKTIKNFKEDDVNGEGIIGGNAPVMPGAPLEDDPGFVITPPEMLNADQPIGKKVADDGTVRVNDDGTVRVNEDGTIG